MPDWEMRWGPVIGLGGGISIVGAVNKETWRTNKNTKQDIITKQGSKLERRTMKEWIEKRCCLAVGLMRDLHGNHRSIITLVRYRK